MAFLQPAKLLDKGKFHEALEHLIQLEIGGEVSEDRRLHLSLLEARGYLGLGMYDKVLELSERFPPKPTIKTFQTTTFYLLYKAEALRILQRTEEANAVLQAVQNRIDGLEHQLGEKQLLGELLGYHTYYVGKLKHAQGELTEALKHFKRGLNHCSDAKVGSHPQLESHLLSSLGGLYWEMGDTEQAQNWCMRGLAVGTSVDNLQTSAQCLNLLGLIAQDKGNYAQALQYFSQSLQLREEVGNRRDIAKTLHSLGYVLSILGKFEEATKYLQQSFDIVDELGQFYDMAQLQHSLGHVSFVAGLYKQALTHYRKALALSKQIGNTYLETQNLSSVAHVHLVLRELKVAEVKYLETTELWTRLEKKQELANVHKHLAEVHYLFGNVEETLAHYNTAFQLASEIKDNTLVAEMLFLLFLITKQEEQEQTSQLSYQRLKNLALESRDEYVQFLTSLATTVRKAEEDRLQPRMQSLELLLRIEKQGEVGGVYQQLVGLLQVLMFTDEFLLTQENEVLHDIKHSLDRLRDVATNNHSWRFIGELFLLSSRYYLAVGEIENSYRFVEEALILSKQREYSGLEAKVSGDYRKLEELVTKTISYPPRSSGNIWKRLELTEFRTRVENLINHNSWLL